jgi:hypothetical protein
MLDGNAGDATVTCRRCQLPLVFPPVQLAVGFERLILGAGQ